MDEPTSSQESQGGGGDVGVAPYAYAYRHSRHHGGGDSSGDDADEQQQIEGSQGSAVGATHQHGQQASTVEYADDEREKRLAQIALPAQQQQQEQPRLLRSRTVAAPGSSDAAAASAAAGTSSPAIVSPLLSRSNVLASPGMPSPILSLGGKAVSSPALSVASGATASSSSLRPTSSWRERLKTAMKASELKPPPMHQQQAGGGLPPTGAASPVPTAPTAVAASPPPPQPIGPLTEQGASELQPPAVGSQMDMTSPEPPPQLMPPPAAAHPSPGSLPFPPLLASPLPPPLTKAAVRPLVPVSTQREVQFPQSAVGLLTQPSASQLQQSQQQSPQRPAAQSAHRRPQRSAREAIEEASHAMSAAQPHELDAVQTHKSSSSRSTHRSHSSSHRHHRHRSGSKEDGTSTERKHSSSHRSSSSTSHHKDKDKGKDADGQKRSHKHKRHKHRRDDSRSSGSGSSGAEDGGERKRADEGKGEREHRHKSKKQKHKHRTSSIANVRPADAPAAVAMKPDPGARLPSRSPPAPGMAGGSKSNPLFPESEEDMWSTVSATAWAASSGRPVSSQTLGAPPRKGTTAIGKGKFVGSKGVLREQSFRDMAVKNKSKDAALINARSFDPARLSAMLDTFSPEETQPVPTEDIVDDSVMEDEGGGLRRTHHQQLANARPMLHVGGGPQQHLVTPPRRMRLSAQLGANLPDDNADAMGDDGWADGGHRRGSGSGGGYSGGGRGKRGKQRRFAAALADSLKVVSSLRARDGQTRMTRYSSQVGGGVPVQPISSQAALLADKAQLVRVLHVRQYFGVRFALASLCSPAVDPIHVVDVPAVDGTRSSSMSIASQLELSRFVAREFGLSTKMSVPPGLLRFMVLPTSEGAHAPQDPSGPPAETRLSGFPDCFLRLSPHFSATRRNKDDSDGGSGGSGGGGGSNGNRIPLLFNVREWSRLVSESDLRCAMKLEEAEWLAEAERAKNRDEVAKRALQGAAASMQQQGGLMRAAVPQPLARADDASYSVDAVLGLSRRAPARGADAAAAAASGPRVLDMRESDWSLEVDAFHPMTSRADQFHALLHAQPALPLASLQPFSPSNLTGVVLAGVVQKVLWRGVNLTPTEEQLQQMMAQQQQDVAAAALPSFIVQDASGGEVEVEVPVAQLRTWGRLLLNGMGAWVQLLGVQRSNRPRATCGIKNEVTESMQRSLRSECTKNKSLESGMTSLLMLSSPRDWMLLTVTEESGYRLRGPSLLAPLSSAVRQNSMRVTPLRELAAIQRAGTALRFNRVTVVGRALHLDNHAPSLWKLYLTDESLCPSVHSSSNDMHDDDAEAAAASVPTSSMLIYLEQAHHAIADTWFVRSVQSQQQGISQQTPSSASSEESFKLVDVRVSWDSVAQVPVLTADEFTDIVKLVHTDNDAADRAEEGKIKIARDAGSKAVKKSHPMTLQTHMIPLHRHHRLRTAAVHQYPIARLLQQDQAGRLLLTPLVQRHAIFLLSSAIKDCPKVPSVFVCCQWCQTLLPKSRDDFKEFPQSVCPHCHRVTTTSFTIPTCWLHYVTLLVHVPAFDAPASLTLKAPAPDTSNNDAASSSDKPPLLVPLQIESSELQALTASTTEETKQNMFRDAKLFKELLLDRHLHFAAMFSPNMHQSSGIDVRSPAAASRLAFQVTTRVAAATADLLSQLSQHLGSQEAWTSQGEEIV